MYKKSDNMSIDICVIVDLKVCEKVYRRVCCIFDCGESVFECKMCVCECSV